MSELQVPIRIKRGVGGAPSSLLRGELAYAEDTQRLYVGEGTSGTNDASGRPIAQTVRELTTPASLLSQLQDVVFTSGLNDGDVLTWSVADDAWIAQAVAAASVAWADVTGKPSTFAPDTHTHAWGDITSGVPSTFAPSTHASSHATGGADPITASDIGAAPASHTHSDATTSVAGFMSAADKTKLDGVASGATANTGTVTSVVGGTGLIGGNITATGTLAVSYGTTAGTACEGNDARLSDSRTPTSHTHAASDITSGLASVATTGAYSDLSGTPTLGTAAAAASTDFIASTAASAFGLDLISEADAGAARTTLGLVTVATTGSYNDLTNKPSTFTPSAHSHTVTLEISGFIEAPEAKTYVLSPSIPAAITITNIKAQTGAGTCDLKLQDDGADIANTTLDDVGSGSVASPGTAPSASVAAGSKLALVVADPSSSAPEDLAFTVYYTVTSANNA